MENWKPITDYTGVGPYQVSEYLDLAGDGVDSDPLFSTAPHNKVFLKGLSQTILTTHTAASSGDADAKVAYENALAAGKVAMHETAVFANFICNGSKVLLTKIKVPFYDSSKSGKPISTFSLTNGPISGQLIMTVPTTNNDAAFIAMYTTDPEALVTEYLLAGGSSHCKFALNNLPIGAKIYVIWASITGSGIGGFSVPYPIIVT